MDKIERRIVIYDTSVAFAADLGRFSFLILLAMFVTELPMGALRPVLEFWNVPPTATSN